MDKESFMALVRTNLELTDQSKDLIISDVMQEAMNYCSLTELPEEMEPFIRKKVKAIMDYEAETGGSGVFDIKSISEGDTSVTYNVSDKISKETIYGLSERDKKTLRQFRRLRR